MCSEPVTFGGGLTIVKGWAFGRAGRNRPLSSQWEYHFASIWAGSKVLSRALSVMARRFASDGQSAQVASATVLPEFAATVPLRTIRRNQGTSCRSTVFPSIRARMREWAEFSLSESDEGGVPPLAPHGPRSDTRREG